MIADADSALKSKLALYGQMLLLRKFEDRVYYLFLQGEVPGTLHQYQGQEAVAVGVCSCLEATDWITSTHRPHGHALAKGVSPKVAMAELYGKSTGCCAGKGGSMHLGNPDVGMLPAIAIVAGGNSIVTGIGLAFKMRQSSQVAACFFGEGATNEGAFHEGLNLAAVRHLPIVYVCENNLYGASTPYGSVSLVADVAERVKGYGIEAHIVDGMDVQAVASAAAEAVARCRSGGGPVLLECKTYRFTGHSRSDARGYRTRDEESAWQQLDPIEKLKNDLLSDGISSKTLKQMEDDVDVTLEEAVEFARQSPDPSPQDALTGVFA